MNMLANLSLFSFSFFPPTLLLLVNFIVYIFKIDSITFCINTVPSISYYRNDILKFEVPRYLLAFKHMIKG